MNANVAHEKATDINIKNDAIQINEIMTLINNEVNCGQFSINYYDNLRPGVRQQLEADGYIISLPMLSGMNETSITISW
jgi:hypothetical protein